MVAVFGLCFNAETQQVLPYAPDRILVKPAVPNLGTLHTRLGTRILKKWERIGNIEVVALPRGMTVERALAALRDSGLVEYAEPDYTIVEAATYPNDPKFTDQTLWNLHNTGQHGGTADADVDAPEGWDTKRHAGNIIVAVIDTGIRYDHQDLAANMWKNPAELNGTPGEGMLFRNPPGGPAVLTFRGQVVQGYGVNPVDNGWTLRSSIIPQAGRLSTDLLFPVQLPGEKVLRMVGGSYVEYTYGSGGWTPSEPQVNVGEAFWSYKDVGISWSRNFLVWP